MDFGSHKFCTFIIFKNLLYFYNFNFFLGIFQSNLIMCGLNGTSLLDQRDPRRAMGLSGPNGEGDVPFVGQTISQA